MIRALAYAAMALCIIGFSSAASAAREATDAIRPAARDGAVKTKPLRVVIRPRQRKKTTKKSLIPPDLRRRIDKNTLDFKWRDILDHRFLSGDQDAVQLKQYGYAVNSDIGRILRQKRRLTDDPDNMLRRSEYSGRQLYREIAPMPLNPVRDIRQGCKMKNPRRCNFTGYGQYWLKVGQLTIDIERSRADDALVNLLKSLN